MKINVGDKNITIRKWKGKDKKNFTNQIKEDKISVEKLFDALVYNCIEEEVVLSKDEFKYVLGKIRSISLGDEIDFEFYCEKCDIMHKHKLKIDDIYVTTYESIKTINVKNVNIELDDIKNKKIYLEKMQSDDADLYDFLLRIKSIDGNDAFTFEELVDYFEELDLDVIEAILEKWEKSKFSINDIHEIACPECKTKTKYKFDELPKFLPDSWFS